MPIRLGEVSFAALPRWTVVRALPAPHWRQIEGHGVGQLARWVTVNFTKALELSLQADQAALKRWYETVSSRASAAA